MSNMVSAPNAAASRESVESTHAKKELLVNSRQSKISPHMCAVQFARDHEIDERVQGSLPQQAYDKHWVSILETQIYLEKPTELEKFFAFRKCYELKTHSHMSQGHVLKTQYGDYVVLALYFNKNFRCYGPGPENKYVVHIVVCNDEDVFYTLDSLATYEDALFEIIRNNPVERGAFLSFIEWFKQPEEEIMMVEGLGEVIDLIGGGCNNVSNLPGVIDKCATDIKILNHSITEITNLISTETTRVSQLIEAFKEKDADGISLAGRIISRVEDFSLLLVGLISCTSVKTAVVMCLQYYKTFVKGPVLLKLTKYITQFFELIGGFMQQKNELKAEGVTDIFEPSGYFVLDAVRWIGSNWRKVTDSDLAKNISNALTVLIAFVCGDEKTEAFVNASTFNLFRAKCWDFSKGSKGFVDLVLSTVQFFIEKGITVMETGNFGSVFYADQVWFDIDMEMNNIFMWSKLLGTGQLDSIKEVSEGLFQGPEDYAYRVTKLSEKLCEYHKVEKNAKNRAIVSGQILRLGMITVSIMSQQKTTAFKEAPFCVMIHGESSIAKSTLMNIITKCVAQANGFPGNFENICSPNESDQYDTEYNSLRHTILHIDDILNTKPEWYVKPPTDRVLRCQNNIPMTVLKADVEQKGLMTWNVKLMVLSTNVKTLKAHIFSNLAAAIMRRIHLIINAYLKQAYRNELGSFKNPGDKLLPNAWNFQIQEVELISRGEAEVNCDYKFVDAFSTGEVTEMLEFVAIKSRVHFAKQRKMVKNVGKVFEHGFCRHFNVCTECDKCNGTEEGSEYALLTGDRPMEQSEMARRLFTAEEIRMLDSNVDVDKMLDDIHEELPYFHESCPQDAKLTREGTMENDPEVIHDAHLYLMNSLTDTIEHLVVESEPESNEDDEWQHKRANEILEAMDCHSEPDLDTAKWTFGEAFQESFDTSPVDSIKNALQDNWKVIAGAGAVVGMIAVIKATISMSQSWSSHTESMQELQVRVPEPTPNEKENPWVARRIKRVPLMVRRSKESASTTYQDLTTKLSRHMFAAKVSTDGKSTCFNILPLESNLWLAPFHSVDTPTPLSITVTNCLNDQTGIEVKEKLGELDVKAIPQTDYAIIRLHCVQPRTGFLKYFPLEYICGSDIVATAIYRPRSDWFNHGVNPIRKQTLDIMEESLNPSGCYSTLVNMESRQKVSIPGHMDYQGFKYAPDRPTFNGLCGMAFVLQARGALIMGMHLAGDGEVGVVGSLTQPQIRQAIDEMVEAFIPMTGEGGITEEQYGYSFAQDALFKEGEYDEDISGKHCFRFMDAARSTAIEIYGPHEKGTRTLRSDVKESVISKSVEEYMDLPRIHGKPKGLGSWKPFQENAQNMMEPCNEFDPDLLSRAANDVFMHHRNAIDELDLAKHVHFVSEDVAINGVNGINGFDRVDTSSSAGHPVDKPKNTLIDMEKSTIDEHGVITKLVFKQEVYDDVETLKDKVRNGERLYCVFRGNIKDEATKFDKTSLRLFAGTQLGYLILSKQSLGGLNRVFQLHWDRFECCISANCYDDDWTRLFQSIQQEGCESRFFCGDYKHWDKSLSPKLLSAAAGVVYDICRHCGYNELELRTVAAVLQELIYPIYEFDGIYAQFLASMPSGVFITVMMSNICNSILFRYTFYAKAPRDDYGVPAIRYDDYVKANFMGDDNIGTVKPECTWWNQVIHAEILGELGITYTSADKKSKLKPFYNKDEATYLKRRFVWDEELQQYLAPIEESSIQKTLHNYMKRKRSLESPESISGSAIAHAANEYFRMGEEVYNRRVDELLTIIRIHDLWKNCALLKGRATFPTYKEMRAAYLKSIELKHGQTADHGAAELTPIAPYEMTNFNEERTIKHVTGATIDSSANAIDQPIEHIFKPEATSEKLGVMFKENKHVTTQTVTFDDLTPQNVYDVAGQPDSTFGMQDSNADNLAGFFERPIKIFSEMIPVGAAYKVTFNPWTLFFTNPRVINRISNYNLMRCKLRLRFLLNGNSFYYGRYIVSYLPLASQDEFEIKIPAQRFIDHVTQASQRPHIYLDPTTSQGGEMLLPFFYYNSNISIPLQEWGEMGVIFIDTIANLQHANLGTDSISLSVFAYAEDMVLSIPTSVEPASLAPQGSFEPEAKDEAEVVSGTISGPASVLAKSLATAAMYPPIRPYALAASYAAEAVSGIARLFGYSRPKLTCVPTQRYKPEYYGNLSNTDIGENISCMALDSKQEVTIDPRVCGLSGTDEMSVASIVAHESYFHTMTWSTAAVSETCLGQIRVDPSMYRQLANAKFLTSTAFVTAPFRYWTGTLNFRFQIICSGFHRGRLRIVYDPVSVLASAAEYNVNYTHVVDISAVQDITVSIPPCQHRPLMEPIGMTTPINNLYTTGATLPAATFTGNGVLSVYVVNELAIPSAAAADVSIAVFISANDDFAVWDPTDVYVGGIVLEPQGVFEPEAMMEDGDMDGIKPFTSEDDMIQNASPAMYTTLANVYTGENSPSIRTWLKRYNYHTSWGANSGTSTLKRFIQQTNSFPYNRGNVTDAVHIRDDGLIGVPYNFCNTTMLNYLSWAYVGWRGSIRWKVSVAEKYVPDANYREYLLWGTRNSEPASSNWQYTNQTVDADSSSSLNATRGLKRYKTGWEGLASTPIANNPVIELDIPYYSDKRFQLCRLQDRTSLSYTGVQRVQGKAVYLTTSTSSTSRVCVDEFVAAGDDFSLHFYIGPPILYFETEFPPAKA
jgi:hypothetical protein